MVKFILILLAVFTFCILLLLIFPVRILSFLLIKISKPVPNSIVAAIVRYITTGARDQITLTLIRAVIPSQKDYRIEDKESPDDAEGKDKSVTKEHVSGIENKKVSELRSKRNIYKSIVKIGPSAVPLLIEAASHPSNATKPVDEFLRDSKLTIVLDILKLIGKPGVDGIIDMIKSREYFSPRYSDYQSSLVIETLLDFVNHGYVGADRVSDLMSALVKVTFDERPITEKAIRDVVVKIAFAEKQNFALVTRELKNVANDKWKEWVFQGLSKGLDTRGEPKG